MRRSISLVAALAALTIGTGSAQAAYTAPELVSYRGGELADAAYSAAISQSGEYVAFAGSFDDVSGIYRKDLSTGEVELVAGANSEDPAISAPDAGAPSISADGRYVSFTTTAPLDPADDPGGCSSVYVRDMDIPASDPGAYVLVSALNGSAKSLTYAGSTGGAACPGGGSAAADRVALSADGREVAFTVIGTSNLTGATNAVETPPNQVAVRDLDTDTTTLVSQTMASLGSTPAPVPDGAAIGQAEIGGSTAAISADGSTVAWMGIEIPAQAPASSQPAQEGGDGVFFPDQYAEPLWRRIGDGPDAPTRRVTGGDDPLGCPEHCTGPLDTSFDLESGQHIDRGPEYGTFVDIAGFEGGLEGVTPQLSADGQVVAILSTQPETGHDPADPQGATYYLTANAFVVNMASGLSRTQALTPLTEWASDDFSDFATTGALSSIAISPDGTRVAFTTTRIAFPLAPPALITPELGQAGAAQLYVANLAAGSLMLVSTGYDGQPANNAVSSPTFAGDDAHTLVFASNATNLVYGAYNQGADLLFTASEVFAPPIGGIEYLGTAPAGPPTSPRWELLLSARPSGDGSVLLYATVPAAGSLQATAKAGVLVRIAERAGKAKRSRVITRTVASATAHPLGAGLVQLRLKTRAGDRSLVERRNGLFATVNVVFAVPHRPTLTGTVQVTFHRVPAKKAAKRK
jgi:Tol biopolymer transport system component